jgi:hypothetical protein
MRAALFSNKAKPSRSVFAVTLLHLKRAKVWSRGQLMIAVESNDALSFVTACKVACSEQRWFQQAHRTANAVHLDAAF